jgi:hypothetical protein
MTTMKRPLYGIEGVLTWTSMENKIDVGPGQALASRGAPLTGSGNHGGRDAKADCVITRAAIGPQISAKSAETINAASGGSPDREDGRDHDSPRSHAGPAAPAGVTTRSVRPKIQHREENKCFTS